MMNTIATVAMAKKMPRRRSVSMPTPKPSSRADRRAGEDLHDERRVERLEQHHRGVGAEAEERAGAEVHVAGVAAEDVPRGGQHHERQHDVGRRRRSTRSRRTARPPKAAMTTSGGCAIQNFIGQTAPGAGRPAPSAGAPKATAGAHEAPSIISTIDSEMPRIRPGGERPGHAAQAGEHHHAEGAADVERGPAPARPGRR